MEIIIAYLLFNFNENNNYQKLFHSFENKDDIYNVDTLILFKDKQPFTSKLKILLVHYVSCFTNSILYRLTDNKRSNTDVKCTERIRYRQC